MQSNRCNLPLENLSRIIRCTLNKLFVLGYICNGKKLWRAVLTFQTILQAGNLDEQKIQDMGTIAATLAYWANIEKLHLTTQQSEVSNALKDLENSIVDLYKKFLMVISSVKGNIVHSAYAPSWTQLYNAYLFSRLRQLHPTLCYSTYGCTWLE